LPLKIGFVFRLQFVDKGKIIVGHCAAALLFDQAGIGEGKKVAGHPYVKSAIKKAVTTDAKSEINDNLYTAQTENAIWTMIPELLKALE
jgi:putative intracellular protease/amidase